MNKLPNFTNALKQLIASTSISSTHPNWDQGNKEVITILAIWFEQLGFKVKIQPVPNTNNKYNMLAKLGSGDGGLLLTQSRWVAMLCGDMLSMISLLTLSGVCVALGRSWRLLRWGDGIRGWRHPRRYGRHSRR